MSNKIKSKVKSPNDWTPTEAIIAFISDTESTTKMPKPIAEMAADFLTRHGFSHTCRPGWEKTIIHRPRTVTA